MDQQFEQMPPQSLRPFKYNLDASHSYTVRNQEDLVSSLFQIEYTKLAQA